MIAVAAADTSDFHIEAANELSRLSALYGTAAETALFATEVALSELEAGLIDQGMQALQSGALVFSGVHLGDVAHGESSSIEQLARTWMGSISSLYRVPVPKDTKVLADEERASNDRLPVLVHEHVRLRHPSLSKYFSDEIKSRKFRRARPAGVSIDFSGSKIVANLATLTAGNQAKSVDMIKRKIFDLIIRRDQENQGMFPRDHEMIVFSPNADSPLASDRQVETLREIHEELSEQSLREQVRFVPLSEVPTIGDRLANAEFRMAS